MAEWTPLTRELMDALYPERPAQSMRGYALVNEGKPILLFAIAMNEAQDFLYMRVHPDHLADLGRFWMTRCLAKGAAILRRMLERCGGPVYAKADLARPGAERLLEYCGFRLYDEENAMYRWEGA